MKIVVYVEGPSDKRAMEHLLEPLLHKARSVGVAIDFIPTEGKRKLITKTPIKAANILCNEADAVVIALPDLYPQNMGIAHQSFSELEEQLECEFRKILERKCIDDERLRQRFKVFCFKYDLEALVLAAEEQLASRLGVPAIACSWIKPVENQNHNQPPKHIVEKIFSEHHDRYQDTIDAPLILGASSYSVIAERCPQCFKPFVEYLESVSRAHV
jgi:hypothetical protein